VKETRIYAWCDACAKAGQRVEGKPVPVAVDGRNPRVIDMCEPHEKELVAPLRDLFETVGQPLDSGTTTSATNTNKSKVCDYPGCGRSFTPQGLATHRSRAHGIASTTSSAIGKRKRRDSDPNADRPNADDALPVEVAQ